MIDCYVGLGSNLERPRAQVGAAIEQLRQLPESRLLGQSSLYRSQPIGPRDQPEFVNAVVRLETGLSPLTLLDRLQALEAVHGRVRGGERWGPRTLDLDLLLYGDQVMDHPRLQLPHPRLAERRFALEPLVELNPELTLPDGRALRALLDQCSDQAVARID